MRADDELRERIDGIETGVGAMIQGASALTDMVEMLGKEVAGLAAEMQRPPSTELADTLERLIAAVDGMAMRFLELDRKLDAMAAGAR